MTIPNILGGLVSFIDRRFSFFNLCHETIGINFECVIGKVVCHLSDPSKVIGILLSSRRRYCICYFSICILPCGIISTGMRT